MICIHLMLGFFTDIVSGLFANINNITINIFVLWLYVLTLFISMVWNPEDSWVKQHIIFQNRFCWIAFLKSIIIYISTAKSESSPPTHYSCLSFWFFASLISIVIIPFVKLICIPLLQVSLNIFMFIGHMDFFLIKY